jgi:hypothetical protein
MVPPRGGVCRRLWANHCFTNDKASAVRPAHKSIDPSHVRCDVLSPGHRRSISIIVSLRQSMMYQNRRRAHKKTHTKICQTSQLQSKVGLEPVGRAYMGAFRVYYNIFQLPRYHHRNKSHPKAVSSLLYLPE